MCVCVYVCVCALSVITFRLVLINLSDKIRFVQRFKSASNDNKYCYKIFLLDVTFTDYVPEPARKR